MLSVKCLFIIYNVVLNLWLSINTIKDYFTLTLMSSNMNMMNGITFQQLGAG